jgi:hypothetical protein
MFAIVLPETLEGIVMGRGKGEEEMEESLGEGGGGM